MCICTWSVFAQASDTRLPAVACPGITSHIMQILTLPALEVMVQDAISAAGSLSFAAASGCQVFVDSAMPVVDADGGLTPMTMIRCMGPSPQVASISMFIKLRCSVIRT